MSKPRVGYFSPVYDGGMHLRALVIALVSYLEIRSAKGKWLIGFSDNDLPLLKQQTKQWLSVLEAYGFDWDNDIFEKTIYLINEDAIINQWLNQGLAYACHCSEDQLKETQVYSGSCRDALMSTQDATIRLRTPDLIYQFTDRLQGVFKQNISKEIGDFVIRDKHGVIDPDLAMVLAIVRCGVTQITRPVEQLSTVVKQLYMQELLGFVSPTYLHVPIILNNQDNSSSLAALLALSERERVKLLIRLLEQLGQPVSVEQQNLTPKQLLLYASDHWCAELIAKGH